MASVLKHKRTKNKTRHLNRLVGIKPTTKNYSTNRRIKLFGQFIKSYLPYLAILAISLSVIFLSLKLYKDQQRFKIINNQNNEIEHVYGLTETVPVFPNSSFAFEILKDDPNVQSLVASNISCYTIPQTYSFQDVKDFYIDNAEAIGWSYIGEATYLETEKENGIYFNISETTGLRIYTVSQDIWYEIITKEQSETMLSERKHLENRLKQIIKSLSGDELPEGYAFTLRYSFEYNLQGIINNDFPVNGFSLENKEEKLCVIPFKWQSNISIENSNALFLSETLKDKTFTVLSSSVQTYNDLEFYINTIMLDDKSYMVASFSNPKENIIFVISGLESSTILFEYVMENIKLSSTVQ